MSVLAFYFLINALSFVVADSLSPVPSLVPSSPPLPASTSTYSAHNNNDHLPPQPSSPLSLTEPAPSSPSSSTFSASGDTDYIQSSHHSSPRPRTRRGLRRSPRTAIPAGRGSTTRQSTAAATAAAGKVGKKKQRSNLPKPVTAILKEWLFANKRHPYPNEDEKEALARQTGLARNQISNWFINARRRILIPILAQDEQENESNHRQGIIIFFQFVIDIVSMLTLQASFFFLDPEFLPYMYDAKN